jgi:hypothetical protein
VLSRLDELGIETYSVPRMRGNRVGFEVKQLSARQLVISFLVLGCQLVYRVPVFCPVF